MAEIYPVRSVAVQGVPAVAVVSAHALRPGDEIRAVKDAGDADRERQSPADSNHCPLCNQVFGPVAFAAHAQDCINARAGRWEKQRDRQPIYNGPSKNGGAKKRFRPLLFGRTPRKGA